MRVYMHVELSSSQAERQRMRGGVLRDKARLEKRLEEMGQAGSFKHREDQKS